LKNYNQFLKNISDIRVLLPSHLTLDPKIILDLVKEYSATWTELDAYDKDKLVKIGMTKKKIRLAGEELFQAIFELKNELIKKTEATIFLPWKGKGGMLPGLLVT
jgi:hypothetical protein